MDEVFIFGLSCLALLLVVGTPLGVLLLFLKSRRLERRLDARIEELSTQLSALGKLRGTPSAQPTPHT